MIDVNAIWNAAYVQYGTSKEAIRMRTQSNNEFIQQMSLGMISLSTITPQTLKVYTNKYKEKKLEEIKSKVSTKKTENSKNTENTKKTENTQTNTSSQKTEKTNKNNKSQSTNKTKQTTKTTSENKTTTENKTSKTNNPTQNNKSNKNSYIVTQNVMLQTAQYAAQAFAAQSMYGNNIDLIM